MVRWCWVNFQCWGFLLIWIRVEQGPTALAMGADGGCLDIFTLVYLFSFLSLSRDFFSIFWEGALRPSSLGILSAFSNKLGI